jgi:hypothetical protein
MRRLEKRQIFISILAIFLMYGLTCYGLSPTITEPTQGESLSSTLSAKMPLNDGESYPVSLPLWQFNESSGVLDQIIAGISLYRVPSKNPGGVWNASCSHPRNIGSADISSHPIDCPDTVFKHINGQTYQRLDIPPPHPLVSL